MIEYGHPSYQKTGRLSLESMQFWTKKCPANSDDPAQRIVQHYQASLKAQNGKLNNSFGGHALEACVYDALVHGGIDPSRIGIAVDLSERALDADADFVIYDDKREPKAAILVKSSLRERWKQVDRDAILIDGRHRDLPVHAVFYRERPDSTREQMINLAANKLAKCYMQRSLKFHTLLDSDTIADVFREIGADAWL